MKNIKFYLLCKMLNSLLCLNIAYGMENTIESMEENISGNKVQEPGSGIPVLSLINFSSFGEEEPILSRKLNLPSSLPEAVYLKNLSAKVAQELKDFYYGKIHKINIDPLNIPNYQNLCLDGEDQYICQYVLIKKKIINKFEVLVDHIKLQAKLGKLAAQNNLGLMYSLVEGVPQDDPQALEWFLKAAGQGHSDAQFNLGMMYEKGQDKKKNIATDESDLSSLISSIENNSQERLLKTSDIIPPYLLSLLRNLNYNTFTEGMDGVTKKKQGEEEQSAEPEFIKWYKAAAEQGHAIAQNHLGILYRNGPAVMKNDHDAIKWFRKGAEQGNTTAQTNLGGFYEDGIVVEQDYNTIFKKHELL